MENIYTEEVRKLITERIKRGAPEGRGASYTVHKVNAKLRHIKRIPKTHSEMERKDQYLKSS
jgi:hypothetical protein